MILRRYLQALDRDLAELAGIDAPPITTGHLIKVTAQALTTIALTWALLATLTADRWPNQIGPLGIALTLSVIWHALTRPDHSQPLPLLETEPPPPRLTHTRAHHLIAHSIRNIGYPPDTADAIATVAVHAITDPATRTPDQTNDGAQQ
ncbi:hypothetical protein J5X84_36300 [Streptosporangiaceae bacterium NEAU-GS5]|nr:hypothetical protein [Streptosporangiaceae bacterium NEAU-GS5]